MFRNHQCASFSLKISDENTRIPQSFPKTRRLFGSPQRRNGARGATASHARYFRIHSSSTLARADTDEKTAEDTNALGTAAVPSKARENTHSNRMRKADDRRQAAIASGCWVVSPKNATASNL
jgi:hypothetical protein